MNPGPIPNPQNKKKKNQMNKIQQNQPAALEETLVPSPPMTSFLSCLCYSRAIF